MAVESIFEFRFPAAVQEEGLAVAKAIGADMPAESGYLDHRVVQDVAEPGHVLVVTRWDSSASADSVLSAYAQDAKVARATELMSGPPIGFVGELLPH